MCARVHSKLSLFYLPDEPLLPLVSTQKGFDVFNALDLMENKTFLEKLKFGIGDGNLQYYLYNWKCPSMGADKVNLLFRMTYNHLEQPNSYGSLYFLHLRSGWCCSDPPPPSVSPTSRDRQHRHTDLQTDR